MKIRYLLMLLFMAPALSYSAQLNSYLEQIVQQRKQGAMIDNGGASLYTIPNGPIPSHIMVWGKGDAGAVQARGGKVINSHYPYFTALIPTDKLEDFKQEEAIQFMKGGMKAKNLMDKAVPLVNADQTYAAGYKGNDVIIGVIDDSIDVYHPDFYNDNGMSRILNVWDQAISGDSPRLFSYGHEWTKDDIDNRVVTESQHIPQFSGYTVGFHGTHVTGIAAGNGSWSDGAYRGVSPEANIIMVKTEGYLDQIINGAEYIMYKAKQLNKPCVINISMGFHFGNHQADDPFNAYMEEVLDYYGAEGNIIVWAAGNEGADPLHTTNMISSSLSTIDFHSPGAGGLFTFYYSSDSRIAVSLDRQAPFFDSTGFTTSAVSNNFANLSVSDYIGNDKQVTVYIKDTGSRDWTLTFQSSPQNIAVHGYLENYDQVYYPGYFNLPISNGTISVSACMENSLSVASFVSRSVYTNYLTNYFYMSAPIGQISEFSSLGPSRDGQSKPEIAAPGEYVIAPLASEASMNPDYIIEQGKYLAIPGTSMAAPVVTGIVAQLLEQNPALTVTQIRAKLIQYAYGNTYKTLYGAGNWDPSYGYGLAAVDGILMETLSGETIQLSLKNNIFKPDATMDQQLDFLVKSLSSDVVNEWVDVKIFSGRGGLVKTYSPQTISGVGVIEYGWNGTDDNSNPVPAGLYFILVQVGNNSHRYPVLIVE